MYVSGKSTSCVLVVFVGLALLSLQPLPSAEGRATAKRSVSSDDSNYLGDLYNRFQEVFQENYQVNDGPQFAVATINRPQNLLPCNLAMNSDLDAVAASDRNYLAYTPLPSTNREGRLVHSETSISNNFRATIQGVTVATVYIVTHFSPCRFCTDTLRTLVRTYAHISFFIGYVERYQNQNNLNYFLNNLANEPNVCATEISPPSDICHDDTELRRRSSTCPVHTGPCGGGGGCFPSTALVHTKNASLSMQDLEIGDKVLTMNPNGHLVYSPVIAFLDRAHTSVLNYIKIETENNHNLLVSYRHLTFTNESSTPIYASDVQPGDYMFTAVGSSDSAELSKVTQVETVSAVGKYAPLTEEGTIIVDGILSSCYADIAAEQDDIHSLFAPLQFLHSVMPRLANENPNQEGIHWYPRTLMQLRKYMKYLPDAFLPNVISG